ncbi:MAG: hypothetical protein IT165_01765 [Bryobacterales bacterium]|nr:hypothetical protein [Bryobacterales bacterium]
MTKSEAARLKPYLHECVCGRVYESRYRRRVLECMRCRRRRYAIDAKRRRADPAYAERWRALTIVARAWRHFRHIALELFGPDANLKSSLSHIP